ncbi:uncharacterized protein LOC106157143 [Lingula anatina]|uniref:Uncharacterized protein LOC106157143 n=1 Tax=Lingula anatina TaxID=7574 RepID=A0A1S3HRD2_LINAN|nr:uncharacterized protein LOC106157143 [Lingula anatina]|eukprot:XP_013388111.1 uncharacterized protein LOC106157143 [Lingula anatina]
MKTTPAVVKTTRPVPTELKLDVKDIEELDKKVKLEFRLPEGDFSKDESVFNENKDNLRAQLFHQFNSSGIEGLKDVEIIGFRNGSIIIDYNLIFAVKSFLGQNGTSNSTLDKIKDVLINGNTTLEVKVNGSVRTFTPDRNYSVAELEKIEAKIQNPCILYDDVDICAFRTQTRDYTCIQENQGVRCKPKCEGWSCSGHGSCIVRYPSYEPECDCDIDLSSFPWKYYDGVNCTKMHVLTRTNPPKTTPARPTVNTLQVNVTYAENLNKTIALELRLLSGEISTFAKHALEVKQQLSSVFNETGRLRGVSIKGFRKGSGIVGFDLVYALKSFLQINKSANVPVPKIVDDLETILDSDINIVVGSKNYTVDRNYSKDQIKHLGDQIKGMCTLPGSSFDICEATSEWQDECVFYSSTKAISCVNKCQSAGIDCSGKGKCRVTLPNSNPKCQCFSEEEFFTVITYVGEHCSESSQTLTQAGIIIITAGVGGFFLLVVIALTVGVVILKRKNKATISKYKYLEGQDRNMDIEDRSTTSSEDSGQESRDMKRYVHHHNLGYGANNNHRREYSFTFYQ